MRAIILAAGKGTRMNSAASLCPKVLRLAGGKPLIEHVLRETRFIPPEDTILVTGFMREQVEQAVGPRYRYAVQDPQMGTGHAVMCALSLLEGYHGPVMVSFGDMPLLTEKTYRAVAAPVLEGKADCAILTASINPPPKYGRILRDAQGGFVDIREEKDCTPTERAISEVNIGINVYNADWLRDHISKLDRNNKQNEYYLTALPAILRQNGARVVTVLLEDISEMLGVNTPEDLAQVESILARRGISG
nr:NTP transferase domain-containing protein [bacterium]